MYVVFVVIVDCFVLCLAFCRWANQHAVVTLPIAACGPIRGLFIEDMSIIALGCLFFQHSYTPSTNGRFFLAQL